MEGVLGRLVPEPCVIFSVSWEKEIDWFGYIKVVILIQDG